MNNQKLWGLIGSSKIREYSVAPHMWKALFNRKGKEVDYFVLGDDKSSTISLEIQDYLKNPNFIGANIALPWKYLGYELCDYVEDIAGRMDTINTLIKGSSKIEGYNTDGIGITKAIIKLTEIKDKTVLILGSGSSSQTIPAHLAEEGVKKIYVNDIIETRAKRLSRKYSDKVNIKSITCKEIKKIISETDIVINTTPCGMYGFKKEFPIEQEIIDCAKQDCLFAEAVYNPIETPLLKYTKLKGHPICPGINMLVEQAAESYFLAFKERLDESDINFMKEVIKEVLKNRKTILITGASGFIGEYLSQRFSKDYEVIGIDIEETDKDYFKKFYKINITDEEKINNVFEENKIDYIIHSAAAKDLKWCEKNRDESYKSNFLATKHLYNKSNLIGSKFVFISSDQVFDGKTSNYEENSTKHPINHYGTLKDLSEEFLMDKGNVAICRTAMVFGKIPQNQKLYFNEIKNCDSLVVQGYIVDHLIHKLTNRERIKLPKDEYCNPTSNGLLFNQIESIIKNNLSGVFHCCGGERISRFDFGKKVALLFKLNDSYIEGSSSNDILRPKDVSMDFKKTSEKIGFDFPNINKMMKEEWNLV